MELANTVSASKSDRGGKAATAKAVKQSKEIAELPIAVKGSGNGSGSGTGTDKPVAEHLATMSEPPATLPASPGDRRH